MEVLTGTSGYAYKEWKGAFYPEDLPAKGMLAYYASRLKTVEINNTFYRIPKRTVVRAWGEAVPDTFSFVLKASQRITHHRRLRDAEEALEYMVRSARELGRKLGPMLFQLPPFLRKGADRLKAFLGGLPEELETAFEFRHDSWFDDEVYEALRERGAALVVSETEDAEPPLVATAPFGYLRLRRTDYSAADLDRWAERLGDTGWDRVYVFFKHEDDAGGPEMAEAFAARFPGEQRS